MSFRISHVLIVLVSTLSAVSLSESVRAQVTRSEPSPTPLSINSSGESIAPGAQSTVQQVPTRILYYFLFQHLVALQKVANQEDAKGKDGDVYRTIYQKAAGLSDNEGITLNEIAQDCQQQLSAMDANIKSTIDSHRAQSATAPKNPLTMSEMSQFSQQRDAILDQHINQLKSLLGDTSFAQLDAYVKVRFHPTAVQPKSAPPTAMPNNGGAQ